jgi:DNA polymerase III epsilon subunit-like protein
MVKKNLKKKHRKIFQDTFASGIAYRFIPFDFIKFYFSVQTILSCISIYLEPKRTPMDFMKMWNSISNGMNQISTNIIRQYNPTTLINDFTDIFRKKEKPTKIRRREYDENDNPTPSKQRKLGDLKKVTETDDLNILSNEITLDENTQERTIEGFKIYFDNDDVTIFDENEWTVVCRATKNNPTAKTLTNKKTKKQIHRIIMKVEDNKDIKVLFKNSHPGDFRKQNLVLEILKQEKNEREKTQHFVFVDTETTGKIAEVRTQYGRKFYSYPRNKDAYKNARLISLSYMITDGMNNTIMEPKHFYVKPSGFEIPAKITNLTGITNEYALEHGSHLNYVLSEFEKDIKNHNVSFFVSHNVLFDSYIMQNSALRRGWLTDSLLLHLETKMKYYCTIKDPIIKNLKFLKLNKMVIEILKEEPIDLHNALNDMMYCKRIFFELRHKNLI